MKFIPLHDWQVTPTQAEQIQRRLASKVLQESRVGEVRLIAGVDISAPNREGVARAAVVVLSYPGMELVGGRVVRRKVNFPYIPGLLSFRESPLILAACEELKLEPDLILVDGQGLAHPRRFGLASHLGVILDKPTIGCAKSRLCGHHEEVGPELGDWVELVDKGEVIGAVLRTKRDSRPLYISIGHKVDLKTALKWTLNCCRGYRLPEPTRLAHLAASGKLEPPQTAGEVQLGLDL